MAITTPLAERRYLNASQMARLTGVSRPAVQRVLESGALPATKLGHRWLIERAVLDAWVRGEYRRPRPAVTHDR